MIKMKSIFLSVVSLGLTLILSGCKWALLDPKGTIAAQEKHIIAISVGLMLLIVVPVIVMCWAFAWRYRSSNTQATYQPEWSHSTLLEVIWWSIPCVIIAILATITWISSHQLDPYRPLAAADDRHKPITVQVIALEWKWLFIYPEHNIATVNFLQIPVNVPVNFLITAEGPMNSFQIPQLGGQIYAMAGMQSKLHLIADTLGDYNGISASFSGEGFSDMKFKTHVSSQEDFDAWIKQVKKAPNTLTPTAYERLLKPSENNAVEYFSAAQPELFQTAMMKTMMPMPTEQTKQGTSEHASMEHKMMKMD